MLGSASVRRHRDGVKYTVHRLCFEQNLLKLSTRPGATQQAEYFSRGKYEESLRQLMSFSVLQSLTTWHINQLLS